MTDPPPPGADFPTYASLTQTRGWGDTVARVDGRMDAAEIKRDGARYIEGMLLGSGGMGKVMLARDERIGRDVAVKELHSRAMSHEEHARFLREARVQGQLEHPSIVPVYDIDRRPDGTVFFTMRRVVGKTMHAIIEDARRGAPGARTQHELLTAFATVCLAIEYAHSRGVVHRDLKPANLMLGDFGEVYVLDWGLARLFNDSMITSDPTPRLSMPGELMGTPMYMAPEQMADPEVSEAADIYSLGAILFEMLTLTPLRDPRAPFVPADARPSERTPERRVAPELEAICVTATAGDPPDRYPSARALHDAVHRYLEGDRDRELRKSRATTHAQVARAALTRADQPGANYEAERDIAMLETVHALAYDPSNVEMVGMLGEILEKPPRVVPPEVRQQLQDEANKTIRSFAKMVGPTMASWLLFLPPFALIGFHDTSRLWLIMIPLSIAMFAGFYAAIRKLYGPVAQVTTLAAVMIAFSSVTWIYGPLIVTPAMIATAAIVCQAFPSRIMRRTSVMLAIGISTGLVVLELSGVLTSYAFEGGRWSILPQLIELPRTGTLVVLLVVNLSTMILPCLFIGHLRRELSVAQQHQLLQSWHFRRLGDQLMRARP